MEQPMSVFFESSKTRKKYEVVKFSGEKVTLRGESGLEFDEKFNPDMFKQMGYTLRRT
jgi:hypothetical protein